ncbi:MAG: formyltransferase family protein [Ardenticatenaceae bacterium]|nr:formyltransferase family protein [Ardenticatenaceae bacterium]
MSDQSPKSNRVLFFGMFGALSRIPLEKLLAANFDICGVIIPQTTSHPSPSTLHHAPVSRLSPPAAVSQLPLAGRFANNTIVQLAWEREIPVLEVSCLSAPESFEAIKALRPDVGFISCFPHKLPPELLSLPLHGFLNLHPSLLPAYRGPEPLFWQLQQGESRVGVTIHRVDEGLDTGDIALQVEMIFADGLSYGDIEQQAAETGAQLALEALTALSRSKLPRRPQGAPASYFSFPTAADFALDLNGPARRAFNFMRGTAVWQRPYPVTVMGRTTYLKTAVDFQGDGRQSQPIITSGQYATVQFNPGILRATL